MKESRLLTHYLRRLASTSCGTRNGKSGRRVSTLRNHVQKQLKYVPMGWIATESLQGLRQQFRQWPLGLSYYNRLCSWTKFRHQHPQTLAVPLMDIHGGGSIHYFGKAVGDSGDDIRGNSGIKQRISRIKERKETLIKDLHETKDQMKHKIEVIKEDLNETKHQMKHKIEVIKEDLNETKYQMKQKIEVMKENIYTIPNLLCVIRIASTPVLGYMIINGQYNYAFGIFVFAGITDVLDGYIARNFAGQASALGSALDPLADKILVATLFLTLTYVQLIPIPLTALIISRDAGLIGAGFVIRYKSLEPPRTLARFFDVHHPTAQLAPTTISKLNTFMQLCLVGSTLVSTVVPYDTSGVMPYLWWITAATTVTSGLSYVFAKDTIKILKKQGQSSGKGSPSEGAKGL